MITGSDLVDLEIKTDEAFKNKEENTLAKKALTYGVEWAKIATSDANRTMSKSQAVKECKAYIHNAIKQNRVYGNVLVTIIMTVVIRLIVNYVANLIIERLLKNGSIKA